MGKAASALLFSLAWLCLLLLAMAGLVLFPLQVDTGLDAFKARDLPMATMNDAQNQANIVLKSLELQPPLVINAATVLSPQTQNALDRQSIWRWAITIIYEDTSGRGVLTAENLVKIHRLEKSIQRHPGYRQYCFAECYRGQQVACSIDGFPNASWADPPPKRCMKPISV